MDQPILPTGGPLQPGDAGASKVTPGHDRKVAPGAGSGTSSTRFQALLEELQARANALQAETEGVEAPEQLAGAVDRARASLEDALSLHDQLLESYRQALQQNPDQSPPKQEDQ